MSRIIVICPVYKREWILPVWFSCIEDQTFPLNDLGFIFNIAPDDMGTIEQLIDFHKRHPEIEIFDFIETHGKHTDHYEGNRSWNSDRYNFMVLLRNKLLDRVRMIAPERVFSLDTDILLENPETIQTLYDLTEELDAVAPLCFMTPDSANFPNIMSWAFEAKAWRNSREYKLGTLFQVDVIMAAVMMSKRVYMSCDYAWHRQGEDLGWSINCTKAGFKLWSASHIYAPHIMSESALANYKKYGDPRKVYLTS